MKLRSVAAAAAFSIAVSGAAEAAIVNVSASDQVGASVSFAAGRYRIAVVGVADGGMYDAAQVDCDASGCDAGKWTNGFTFRDPEYDAAASGSGGSTLDIFTVGALGSTYGTAAASLAAYQAGPIDLYGQDIVAGVPGAPYFGLSFTTPIELTLASAITYRVVVSDFTPDFARYNLGGVSLSITAVPEPGAWVLMLTGVGVAGAALRHRRRMATA